MLSRTLPAALVTALAVLVTAPLFAQSPTPTSPLLIQLQVPVTAGQRNGKAIVTPDHSVIADAPQTSLRNLLFTPRDAAQVRLFHPIITPQSVFQCVPVQSRIAQPVHTPK
jgi:hypothetical protein